MIAVDTTRRARLSRYLHKRGWTRNQGSWRDRTHDLVTSRAPWYDWGHRVMVLVGQDHCGNWSEPQPPTWWYRLGNPKRMRGTGYPRHPLSTFEVVTDYDEFMRRWGPLNEDGRYEWKALAVDQDGELTLGHRYWGGAFYGMRKEEAALLRRYLRMWHRLDWFGLRSWLYHQGLHAAVNLKVPFSCQVTPPSGSGGYSHWHCQSKRGHTGAHRYNNYRWGPQKDRVEYAPGGASA